MGNLDPVQAFAETLVKAREEEEQRYGIPVDDFQITLGLTVKAKWCKGIPGNRWHKEEPAGYEIAAVLCKGKDITFLFDADDMKRLEQELLD